jgi:hypothetical protein
MGVNYVFESYVPTYVKMIVLFYIYIFIICLVEIITCHIFLNYNYRSYM